MAALNVDALSQALSGAAKSAGMAASTAGRDLTGDIDNFVIPELREVAAELVLIQSRTGERGLSQDTASLLVAAEVNHAVITVSAVVAELTLLEVQNIINAALKAIADVVNAGFGFKIL